MTDIIQSAISLLPNETGIHSAIRNLFWERYIQGRPSSLRYEEWWAADSHRYEDVRDKLPEGTEFKYEDCRGRLYSVDKSVDVYITSNLDWWTVLISGSSEKAVDAHFAELRELIPVLENRDEDVIPIAFWALDSHGNPNSTLRKVDSHRWDNIRDNYPIDVKTRLDDLMKVSEPGGSGKLVLWHGEPGTGKTNCIRALAHSWRTWCDVDYIVDPEELFGRAHYMMSCLVNGRNDTNRWRLIVIEDSGEFLRKDAKATAGQGFGRLLNLTDGLVGQGLKLIILVTTNEPFGDLHPAVARPGRCLARLEFDSFPPDEASHWLGQKVTEPKTLADLYELRAEHQTQITKDPNNYRPGVYV